MANDPFVLRGLAGPPTPASDGGTVSQRYGRLGDAIVTELHGRYYEQAKRGKLFALIGVITSTTIAAGNITGAAAAASTQFALWNPLNSGVDLVLSKVWCSIISGTLPAAPMTHDFFSATGISVARKGLAQSAYGNAGPGPQAADWYVGAGAAITGAGAHTAHRLMGLNFSAGTYANLAGSQSALEELNGDIIIPPGVGWAPCFAAAGTTLVNAWAATWEEVPV